jgi:hypothetical protein
MKIRSVSINARRKAFRVDLPSLVLFFPFVKADPAASAANPVVACRVDPEIAREGFTYTLASGAQGTVHVEQVLEYNEDPGYLREQLLYRLTLAAQQKLQESRLAKREVARLLATSQAQLYRLLDQTNYRKSVDQMLGLLQVLHCDVDFVVRERGAA